MRPSLLRKIVVASASVALIFFCSCERHHPEELAGHEEHARSAASEHEQPHPREQEARARSHGDDQKMSTTAMSATPAPASPTPAEFFPTATPH